MDRREFCQSISPESQPKHFPVASGEGGFTLAASKSRFIPRPGNRTSSSVNAGPSFPLPRPAPWGKTDKRPQTGSLKMNAPVSVDPGSDHTRRNSRFQTVIGRAPHPQNAMPPGYRSGDNWRNPFSCARSVLGHRVPKTAPACFVVDCPPSSESGDAVVSALLGDGVPKECRYPGSIGIHERTLMAGNVESGIRSDSLSRPLRN